MEHYVYQITNILNGKYYRGKHSAESLDNDYMGSGTLIRAAIEKYGIENFKKTILKTFPTSDEAFEYEAQVVTMKEVNDPMCYNLMPGGKGGQKRFTDEELKEHALESQHQYRQSQKGKEAHREYDQSPKGKETKRKAWRKHNQTPKGKETKRKACRKWHEQNPNYRKEYYLKKKLEQAAKSR